MLAHLCTEHSNTPSVCIVVNRKMRCDRYSKKQRRVKHKTTWLSNVKQNWGLCSLTLHNFLPHLSHSIPVTGPASVRQRFQTSSPLRPLGQLNSNFIWRLLRTWKRKVVQMVLVTWPRWPPRPYMEKTLQKSSSPEPEGRWPRDLVCSIGDMGPTKFVQMMILGWPWST